MPGSWRRVESSGFARPTGTAHPGQKQRDLQCQNCRQRGGQDGANRRDRNRNPEPRFMEVGQGEVFEPQVLEPQTSTRRTGPVKRDHLEQQPRVFELWLYSNEPQAIGQRLRQFGGQAGSGVNGAVFPE